MAGDQDHDRARQKLQQIDHIVVLQLENRSFDHMLGYLGMPEHALTGEHEGEFDTRVNGIVPGVSNSYKGTAYTRAPLDESAFDSHRLDPPHDAPEVARQLAGGAMSGFVEAWAAKLERKVFFVKRFLRKLLGQPAFDDSSLNAVMGYVTPDMVPVFDHLARNFCVCDNWYCSVAGPTMPNRFFSVAGTTQNTMSNLKLLVSKNGKFRSLFRYLANQHTWRWYSSDPGILRAVDEDYRFDTGPEDHFAYFDQYTHEQPRTFLGDVRTSGELPPVAWIDPNFAIKDMIPVVGGLLDTPGSNDDHPPSKVIEAQRLVNKVYEAIGRSDRWDKTLIVIYYDEHGGFHDHQSPPGQHGPRIPALLVGPRVKRGVCHEQFDHASLIKTVLLRFGKPDALDRMPRAVAAATDLSVALREDDTRLEFSPVPDPGRAAISAQDLEPAFLAEGSTATRAVEFLDMKLTDLQRLIVQHHAIPLRTGVRSLGRLRSRRAVKLIRPLTRPVTAVRRRRSEVLPPRRP
ncbi:MAG: phospholipase [Thermoleophilaceae bacterium]|nr:phospholipase [Thermoleophilaceae bacterium]